MTIASIDIGTNTILMLIAEVSPGGTIRTISDEQVIARIGKGVDRSGAIAWDAFTRSEDYLTRYLEKARAHNVDVVRVTGTSALRDAHNRDDYLDYMHQRLGIDIEILNGEDEALWTYGGAISGIVDKKGSYAVLDIGGGSTELTVGRGLHIVQRKSLDIGCVRLTEKHLSHTPPTDGEVAALLENIDAAILAYPDFDVRNTTFVGVAGTVTTLAAIERGLTSYDGEAIAGTVLETESILKRFEQFRRLSREQLQGKLRIDPGRADIILVGVAILARFMSTRGIPSITVSERGLRYGIVMREWERSVEGKQ